MKRAFYERLKFACPNCGTELVGPRPVRPSGLPLTDRLGRVITSIQALLILPGFVIQLAGVFLAGRHVPRIGIPLAVLGTLLLGVGLGLYSKARGRQLAWGLLGLLNCVGMLLVLALSKRCTVCKKPVEETATSCGCGAPAAPHK